MTIKITAPQVSGRLDDHLQKHEDVFYPMLKMHDILLLGEKKDNGLCSDVKEIKAGYATMKTIGIAILIALLGNIMISVIK